MDHCECGSDGPSCGGREQGAVDFADYSLVLQGCFGRIKESIKAHGDWREYDEERIFAAISGEFGEYWRGVALQQRHGDHGQIDELYDLMVVAAKGILRLSMMEGTESLGGRTVLPPELDECASDDVLVQLEDLCFAVGFYDFTAKSWMTRWGFELPAVVRWMPIPMVD